MRKPISTKTHAFLDYLTIAKFLLLPRVMNFSTTVTNGMTAVALVKLGYTLLTRHEGGVAKVLPMKAHLAMDVAGGAMLCALPFASDDTDETEIGVCCALGAFDINAAPLTETEMRPTSRASIRQQVAPMSETDYRMPQGEAEESRRSVQAWS
jgi:hypothetical protein